MFRFKLAASLAAAALLTGLAGTAQAATTTTTFPVTATVIKACVVSATALAFGNYDPTATGPTDATSTLSILCTVGTTYTVGLTAGTASGATVTTRKMSSGSNLLSYALYQDSAHTTNWGNTPATDTAAATAPVGTNALTVYGRITAGQNVPIGSYSDTITVNVVY
ncbi:spore coat U domain-containing protein [Sphingobium yanoikuyae]|uniref:Csu type fimbrial protein n=1 Tax=Sphingobium yanoikuyae TaxID=13690 RepID=UPI0008463FB4|nr:spore coat U domain-containing protein [Sphingobium yanoikuyae]MDG2514381.1 spore coat U domain-containing protein [Sphingobium yanoikuyae]